MKLQNILFLAANTKRSHIYAQAMAHYKLLPENVVIFGQSPQALLSWKNASPAEFFIRSFAPKSGEKLSDTFHKTATHVKILKSRGVNDSRVFREVSELRPNLIVYSGYSGEIVSSKILKLGIPILHFHAGLLPKYKGSTTTYYSWLLENKCGVSAIIIDENIDTGRIVAKKSYPVPPRGVDMDDFYDSSIRADLMVKVLKNYCLKEKLSSFNNSKKSENTFYIIHPLLKHIVLRSQESIE